VAFVYYIFFNNAHLLTLKLAASYQLYISRVIITEEVATGNLTTYKSYSNALTHKYKAIQNFKTGKLLPTIVTRSHGTYVGRTLTVAILYQCCKLN